MNHSQILPYKKIQAYFSCEFCNIHLMDNENVLYWNIDIPNNESTRSMTLKDLILESNLTAEQKIIVNKALNI